MKISILLPYKENYSKDYAGAVSIFVNGVNRYSKFKNKIKVYGNTNYPNLLSRNYINLPLKKNFFQSTDGATAIEYGLIAALVSVAILAALNNFGDSTENMYNFIEKSIVDVS